jgi:hypothetical protein
VIDGLTGGNMVYNSLQIKATKSFSNGYTLLFGSNYHVQANQTFPAPQGWFNTSVFKQLPAYTRRSNPWYHSDIRGPRFINLDGTLNKDFAVTEGIKFQLHMDAFNALNNMNFNNPNMSVISSQFGKSTDIYPGILV